MFCKIGRQSVKWPDKQLADKSRACSREIIFRKRAWYEAALCVIGVSAKSEGNRSSDQMGSRLTTLVRVAEKYVFLRGVCVLQIGRQSVH